MPSFVLTPCLERRLTFAAGAYGVHRLVAAAVVAHRGRVLLLRRRPGDFMGGRYELPSGVVEPGEGLKEALYREVWEETRLRVTAVAAYLGSFDYTSGSGRATRQFNFLVNVSDFAPLTLSEHDAFIWAGPEDLPRLHISGAVREVLAHPSLRQVIAGTPPGQTGGPAEFPQSD